MPGFCGIFKNDSTDVIDTSFNVQDGITQKIERDIQLDKLYIRQYLTPKFEMDKPFIDTNELFVCMDGIIINGSDLYPEYNVTSISELIISMYHMDGIEAISKLRGNFSGVIVDRINNLLHLFTDHLGSKRVFYYNNTDTNDLLFASDLKVLTTLMKNCGLTPELSEGGAYCLLSMGYMLGNNTLCKDAIHLEPGTILTLSLDTGTIRKKQYFSLSAEPVLTSDEDTIIQELDRLFSHAVDQSYKHDKDYGYQHISTISGGLDSRMELTKAHMMEYSPITTFTFCESGYTDQLVSQQISADFNCDFIFHALDNGNFVINPLPAIIANDGQILYHGAASMLASINLLNIDKYGIVHTGMEGECLKGNYVSNRETKDIKNALRRFAYSKRLFYKIPSSILKDLDDKYSDEELCLFLEHGVNGSNNGHYMIQHYTEYHSPFMDVDFVNYILKIPKKYKLNTNIYKKWIKRYAPLATKYKWEATGTSINAPVFLEKFHQLIRLMKRKIFTSKGTSMNPFDYWYANNKKLREAIDFNYKKSISKIDKEKYGQIILDCEELYHSGTVSEKLQVLTLLMSYEYLELS